MKNQPPRHVSEPTSFFVLSINSQQLLHQPIVGPERSSVTGMRDIACVEHDHLIGNLQRELDGRVTALQREVVDAADKLKRLYRIVEDGVAELDDILRDRIASLTRPRAGTDRTRSHPDPSYSGG